MARPQPGASSYFDPARKIRYVEQIRFYGNQTQRQPCAAFAANAVAVMDREH
jgi:hypothetical protein